MRKMKTKLLVILCVMIFAGAIMVGPVAAAETGVSTITANITQELAIVVTGNINGWNLIQGGNNDASSITLQLTSNYPSWRIAVNDSLDNSKPATSRGKMAEYGSGNYNVIKNYNLSSLMQLTGTPDPVHFTAYGPVTLATTTPQTLYLGHTDYTGAGDFSGIPVIVDQAVSYSDPVLDNGEVYRIVVTFIASLV
jgi:hypothetical protein